jgi:hypothetical protein
MRHLGFAFSGQWRSGLFLWVSTSKRFTAAIRRRGFGLDQRRIESKFDKSNPNPNPKSFLEDSIVSSGETLKYIISLSFKFIRKDVFILVLSI